MEAFEHSMKVNHLLLEFNIDLIIYNYYHQVEERFSIEDLGLIMQCFETQDSEGLTMEQFCHALGRMIGRECVAREQLAQLFMFAMDTFPNDLMLYFDAIEFSYSSLSQENRHQL